MEVDYLRLSEQYANFLIAIGGVSITVLALVLSSKTKPTNVFLVASLVVATISCFTGAHMMAETAAFIASHPNKVIGLGQRLFLLASINIFIAVVLVIFALMLLPMVLMEKNKAAEIKLISISVFAFVIIAVLNSVILSVYRMPAPCKWYPIGLPFAESIFWGVILFSKSKELSEKVLLGWSFIPVIVFTLISLLRFAWTLNDGGYVDNTDICLFSLAITSTCASLFVVVWIQLELKESCRRLKLRLRPYQQAIAECLVKKRGFVDAKVSVTKEQVLATTVDDEDCCGK